MCPSDACSLCEGGDWGGTPVRSVARGLPVARTEGPPPPEQTGNVVGGTPFTVMQEDFLVQCLLLNLPCSTLIILALFQHYEVLVAAVKPYIEK